MPRRKPVIRSGRKYGHIKLESLEFPREIDQRVINDFLESEMGRCVAGNTEVHDWKTYYDSDPEDIQLECIFDDMNKAIPSAPSTILDACSECNVYMWLVPDRELKAFKKELNRELRQYAESHGSNIFRKEISNAIERGLKHGFERDDIVKIMDEIIAKDVMED
jgi:hypothetical protein